MRSGKLLRRAKLARIGDSDVVLPVGGRSEGSLVRARLVSLAERIPAARILLCRGEMDGVVAWVRMAGPISDSIVSLEVIKVMVYECVKRLSLGARSRRGEQNYYKVDPVK